MSENPFDPESVDELPARLRVFPLPSATLLPGIELPLNIFEPRYLNMTLDALSDSRMIGMVQPQVVQEQAHTPVLYDVGCAGRITSFAETADGRLMITLRGLCRFRLGEELDLQRGYRSVVPSWLEFANDLDPVSPLETTIGELQGGLQEYLRAREVRVDWAGLGQISPAQAIDFLAMNLPFSAEEKQALVEAKDSAARWQVLLSIARMLSPSSALPPPGATRH
ncbi:MAG: Lon protease-like protein [Gammaproteobacteria bacterium]|jgi:Lon protease-like protein